ncbi:MAG TPA: 4-alpha-glucanotransferase, partial [Euzebyales bacterium]|nr:4-alpha-glucanotransferase [Euzebyales bacterium]
MPDTQAPTLARLARAAGVAVRYEASGIVMTPPDATVRVILTELGHPCDDEAAAASSLRALRRAPWVRPVDPVAVQWADAPAPATVTISAPAGEDPEITLTLEDGATQPLRAPLWGGRQALADGGARRRGTVTLPTGLPMGYHDLAVAAGGEVGHCTVIAAPASCPLPDRGWGWMVQTYAVRSSRSWGQGEFSDLGTLAAWSAGRGAAFVLSNPVHAPAPTLPQQPSPYSPTSRRFYNPCYLHVPDVPGFAALDAERRAALLDLPAALRPDGPRIDRDAIWTTKRAALRELFDALDPAGHERLAAYRRERGTSLERFTLFCALAEAHGLPFDDWPA